MTTMKLMDIVADFNVYPRHQVNMQHAADLTEALRAGAELPALIVDAHSHRLVDGFHRWRAYKTFHGKQAGDVEVAVEQRRYATEAELFLDAVRLNADHGERISHFDIARCTIIGEQLHIDPAQLAAALSMRPEKLNTLTLNKVALTAAGSKVALRLSVRHLAGEHLTKKQSDAAQRAGGATFVYYLDRLIDALRNDLLPNDPKVQERLKMLIVLLVPSKKKVA